MTCVNGMVANAQKKAGSFEATPQSKAIMFCSMLYGGSPSVVFEDGIDNSLWKNEEAEVARTVRYWGKQHGYELAAEALLVYCGLAGYHAEVFLCENGLNADAAHDLAYMVAPDMGNDRELRARLEPLFSAA